MPREPHNGGIMARILVVDDSPTQNITLCRMLEKHGHQTLSATNGKEGVATAKQEQPDAVLMDVVMPELNGFQATRQLSQDPATSHIPVVIISTKDQDFDRIYAQRQGAKGYLIKPPSEAELIKTLDGVLAPA